MKKLMFSGGLPVLVGVFLHESDATASLSQAHRDSDVCRDRNTGARVGHSGTGGDD